MGIIEPKDIKEVCIPKELERHIKKLGPEIIKTINKNDPNSVVESGRITLGYFNKQSNINLFLFQWIINLNEIIYNLNLIILDLKNLPNHYSLISGLPYKRYQLLVRTYFYEFYRFKEIFYKSLKLFQKIGFLEKESVQSITNDFCKRFNPFIDMRNTSVHGEALWKGKSFMELMLVSHSYEFGYLLKDIETGEFRKISEVLQNMCDQMASILIKEGNSMSSLLQKIVYIYVKILQKYQHS